MISHADTALSYAQTYGWSVHPIRLDKTPATKHGRDDATRDEQKIKAYFRNGAQIGVATGPESGLFVLDIDLDEKRGINGYETLQYLETLHGKLPRTPCQKTGRGGTQYLFNYQQGLKNSAGKIGAGIDTRGQGGYIVVAPSRNTNGPYTWIVSPEDAPLADVPQWLIDALAEAERAHPTSATSDDGRPYCLKMLGQAVARVATASDGQKHDVLLKMSTWMGGFIPSISETEIETALFAAIELRAEDHAGARKTIRDGIAYGKTKPLHAPAPYQHVDPQTGEIIEPPKAKTEYINIPSIPIDVNDLLAMERKSTLWYAPSFLREGLGLLVGQPNVGKTPAAIQLAIAIATGQKWLNTVQCKRAKVLYLGMEYSPQELIPMFDISRMGQAIPRDWLMVKTIEDDFPTNPEAALDELEWYLRVMEIKVIIIDVLTAFLPPEKFKQNVYRGDYSELKPYHRLALKYNAAIFGVWHASKREADPKIMYNGSTGMWAAAASRVTMYQDKEQRVRIASFPRMGDRIDWALAQENTSAGRRWVLADANPEPMCTPTELEIYRCLKAHATSARPIGTTTIAELTSIPMGTVKSCLSRMYSSNIIHQPPQSSGYYVEVATPATVETPETPATVETVSTQEIVADFSASQKEETTWLQGLQDSTDARSIFDSVPPSKVTILRLYLRSNKDSDQERGRELCDEYGIDYEEARSLSKTGQS